MILRQAAIGPMISPCATAARAGEGFAVRHGTRLEATSLRYKTSSTKLPPAEGKADKQPVPEEGSGDAEAE